MRCGTSTIVDIRRLKVNGHSCTCYRPEVGQHRAAKHCENVCRVYRMYTEHYSWVTAVR